MNNPNRDVAATRAEMLACRLVLIFLDPDQDMTPFHLYAVYEDSGVPIEYFEIALRTAVQAADAWTRCGQGDYARMELTDKLKRLTVTA